MTTPTRRLRRILLGTLAATAFATVAVGALHMPFVMKLAGGGAGGCPFGKDVQLAPAERQAHRHAAMQRLKGDGATSARPAGDFALGATTRAEVIAWAAREQRSCRAGKGGAGLECRDPDGARRTVYLDFDSRDLLVGMLSMTYLAGPDEAGAQLAAVRSSVERAVGAPTSSFGESTPSYLSARALRQSRTEYRRANYFASLSATNLGAGGYLVSQVYQAID